MSNATLELPTEWASSVVVRHLDAPYSDEALAEPFKDWIDLGEISFADLPTGKTEYGGWVPVKESGEDFDLQTQPEVYRPFHSRFISATRLILGKTTFLDSRINFDHWNAELKKGRTHTYSEPHMDGVHPSNAVSSPESSRLKTRSKLKLIGTAVNDSPTGVLQGPVTSDDFHGAAGTRLREKAILERSLRLTEIPLGRLIIMAPATVHYAQEAKRYIRVRHFIRWQVMA